MVIHGLWFDYYIDDEDGYEFFRDYMFEFRTRGTPETFGFLA